MDASLLRTSSYASIWNVQLTPASAGLPELSADGGTADRHNAAQLHEVRMSTKRTAERLDEMCRRIDMLEARAQAAGATAKESIKREIDALRQEASARAAAHEAHDPEASETPAHTDPTKDKYLYLDTRLGALESEIAAEIARGPQDRRPREGA
jgi:chromosome segregation ATPase